MSEGQAFLEFFDLLFLLDVFVKLSVSVCGLTVTHVQLLLRFKSPSALDDSRSLEHSDQLADNRHVALTVFVPFTRMRFILIT